VYECVGRWGHSEPAMSLEQARDSSVYYDVIGRGKWRGRFSFRVVSWPLFRAAKLGFRNRLLVVGMALVSRLFGRARIDSDVWSQPELGVAGIAGNTVRISRFGVTLYLLRETYTLDPDGSGVRVHAHERFGPIPFLLRVEKRHPATIHRDGMGSTYLIPLLGADWTADYTIADDRRHIDGRLSCAWGEALEVIDKVADGAPRVDVPVDARLRSLERRLATAAFELESARDSRCVFTYAYAMMTRRIAADLPKRTDVDAAWIVSLAEAFAARYFEALDAGATRAQTAWSFAFDAMRRRTSVVEDLVIAMAVHIAHDLPHALERVTPLDGHVADFHAVNDMMGSSIETIQRDVALRYSPYVRWLDRLAGQQDEILTNYGIRLSRGMAWYNAARLLEPGAAEAGRRSIERTSLVFVQSVLEPPVWSLRQGLRLFRLVVSLLRRWPVAEPMSLG
jgi:hypothetical protein